MLRNPDPLFLYKVKAKERLLHRNSRTLRTNHRRLKCPNIAPWTCFLAAADSLKASTRLVNARGMQCSCRDVVVVAFLHLHHCCFPFRYDRDSVGHRNVGAGSTGLQAQQPRHHGVHGGLQRAAQAGHVGREDQLSGPEAASEGRRGDAVRGAALPRIQRHEPLQLSHLLKVQELPRGLLSQVGDRQHDQSFLQCVTQGAHLKCRFPVPPVTVTTTDQSSSCWRTSGTLFPSKARWS